jgi:hypothetical protein
MRFTGFCAPRYPKTRGQTRLTDATPSRAFPSRTADPASPPDHCPLAVAGCHPLDIEALLRSRVRCASSPLPVRTRPRLSWASLPETMCTLVPETSADSLRSAYRCRTLASSLLNCRAFVRCRRCRRSPSRRVCHASSTAPRTKRTSQSPPRTRASHHAGLPNRLELRRARAVSFVAPCPSRSRCAGQRCLCRDAPSLRSTAFRRYRGNRSPQSGPGRPRHRVSPIRGRCG